MMVLCGRNAHFYLTALLATVGFFFDLFRSQHRERRIVADWLAKHGFLHPLKPRDRK